ncbi:MAG TPA: hypothetical protein VIV61_07345 [Candidatus Ozemobacteraceae bacterium]
MNNANIAGFRRPPCRPDAGVVFFVVLAVFLVMAVLAFALSTFKGGAIEQLSKSIDQNRLAMLAQAANNEIIGILRSQANLHAPGGAENSFYKAFRDPIRKEQATGITLPYSVNIFPANYTPVLTQELATKAGYRISITSQATINLDKRTSVTGTTGFGGYIEIVSRAEHLEGDQTKIEIKERRDLKLVDMRHYFDRYALFVKHYSPDWNNPRRRVVVQGIPDPDFAAGVYSSVYIGNHYYPKCREFDQTGPDPVPPRLWFDVNYAEQRHLLDPLMNIPTTATERFAFPGIGSNTFKVFFGVKAAKYWDIAQFEMGAFYEVVEIKKQYVDLVNRSAIAILGGTGFVSGPDLKARCQQAISSSNSNSNSAAWAVCKDFASNVSADCYHYANCDGFKQMVQTCVDNWVYRWGYTDAAAVWDLTGTSRLPVPSALTGDVRLAGLATQTSRTADLGAWMFQNLSPQDDTANPPYNQERAYVGKMARLYGPTHVTPVLVEGNAWMRFFKLAYFDELVATFTLLNTQVPCILAPVPLEYYRKDPVLNQDDTFLNQPSSRLRGANELFAKGTGSSAFGSYVEDASLMSRAVDTVPLNRLIDTDNVKVLTADGSYAVYNPKTDGVLLHPQQMVPAGKSVKPGHKMYRIIDENLCSRNYYDPQSFLRERVIDEGGTKTLWVDGYMYITEGDLDLTKVERFAGRGLIFLGKGNCKIGTLLKKGGRDSDQTLRILLLDGDFLVESASSDVEIQASLIANTYVPAGSGRDPAQLSAQGSFNPNNKSVKIYGNLIVDYLFTESGNNGVPQNGTLTIIHDPLIYNPEPPRFDPCRVSIGSVRTMFSMNAAGRETF